MANANPRRERPRNAWMSNAVLAALAAAFVSGCASHPKPPPPAASPPPPAPAAPAYEPPPPPPPAPVQTGILPGTVRDFVVNVGDRVYFDYNAIDLKPEARAVLGAQAAWLARYPAVQVRIEGNCDERGTEEYNFALGAKRAASVKDFLAAHGVATARISTVSYGKDRPVDTGTGEEAWKHNRNAHTAIISGAS